MDDGSCSMHFNQVNIVYIYNNQRAVSIWFIIYYIIAMLLIVAKIVTGIPSHVPKLRNCLDDQNIPYIITEKCDPVIIQRKDIIGIIIPGSPLRIRPGESQDALELELYYLFHFPKLPVLGICYGCQFLMMYYGGDLVQYNNYWSGSKDIELDLSRDRLFKGEERRQKIHVYFHDLPVITLAAKKVGVREIAWITQFRDGRRRACAFEFVKDRVYGIMFHPEGKKGSWSIIYNFYDNVCMSSASSS
jgi:GMP synthase-like glutamine amidotransferase